MSERDYSKRYEEIMRNAETRKRELNRRARRRERALRELMATRRRRGEESQDAANKRLIEQIDKELLKLKAKLERLVDREERILLKAEISHLQAIREGLANGRRKPPESGVPVPAIPPKGPFPKQGGAEAPLDFER